MIQYIAFLRGINFGGNKKIDMKTLKAIFEGLGFFDVSTCMNSGNIIFLSANNSLELANIIEKAILQHFHFEVKTLVITHQDLYNIYTEVPPTWQDKAGTLPHIAFLWKEQNNSSIFQYLGSISEYENMKYTPSAILWNVDLKYWSQDKIYRYLNGKVSHQVTIRSINTIKKIIQKIEA